MRIDLHTEADIRADMYHLPVRKGLFSSAVCDPPWGIPYHKRHLLLYQLRDSLKAGGRLIFNAFWFPRVKGLRVEEWLIGVPKATWRNVSLLIVASKVQGQLEEFSK